MQTALALEQFVFCYLREKLLDAAAVAVKDGVEGLLVCIPPCWAVTLAALWQGPATMTRQGSRKLRYKQAPMEVP